MNRVGLIIRQRIFIVIFIILAALGGLFIYWYINRQKDPEISDHHVYEVLTAAYDIAEGTEITEDMVEYREIPENVYSEDFIFLREEVIGKKTDTDIEKGKIISVEDLEEGLKDEEEYLKFSSYIPSGHRAVNIPVNYYGDTPLITCGDKVDIISTYYNSENDQLVSNTVLAGKEIILIEGKKIMEAGKSSPGEPERTEEASMFGEIFREDTGGQVRSSLIVITLYLYPDEVEQVFLAMESGVLNISICPGR